jgi:hypothetical protein
MSPAASPGQPRPFLLRPGVLLAEAALILLLLLGIVLVLRQDSTDDAAQAPLPDSIAGLRLVSYVQGEEAVAGMSQLHIRGITLADGYIGHYEGGAVVWVGIAGDQEQARQMVQAMTDRIAGGAPPFSAPQALEMDGKTVYMVIREGQEHHFYYQKGRAVIWVQLPPSNMEAFLREALQLLHD